MDEIWVFGLWFTDPRLLMIADDDDDGDVVL